MECSSEKSLTVLDATVTGIELGLDKNARQTAVAIIDPVSYKGELITRVNAFTPTYVSEISAGVGSKITFEVDSRLMPKISSVVSKSSYSDPSMPEKIVIGSLLTVNLDEIYALLD